VADKFEKFPLASKKFVAFLIVEIGLFVIMGLMVSDQEIGKLGENVAFMVLAVTAGMLASFYIGGQALVDRYIRVAQITMSRGTAAPEGEKK